MNISPIKTYSARAKHPRQVDLLWGAHEIISGCLINGRLQTKWGIPMYCYIKDICWLNYYKDHIYVSFYQGKQLSHPMLDDSGLKLSSKYYIKDISQLEEDALPEILFEAIALQEELYKK